MRWSTSRESTAWKFALRFLSERLDHEPLPAASLTPAVGAPVPASTALTKRTPPLARPPNPVAAAAENSLAVESAQVNAPWRLAFACRPAARLYAPPARLETPPGTVAPCAAATLVLPPPTALYPPPATL